MGKDRPKETKEEPQSFLFDKGEKWQEAWQGMPEFVQEDLQPVRTIYVHFETHDDVEAFSKLIGQLITSGQKAVWYPEAEIGRFSDKRYIDVEATK